MQRGPVPTLQPPPSPTAAGAEQVRRAFAALKADTYKVVLFAIKFQPGFDQREYLKAQVSWDGGTHEDYVRKHAMTATTADRTDVSAPDADIRTRVTIPLRFADGYATSADVFTFTGLVDGEEHLLLGLGDWHGALRRAAQGSQAPLVRPHSECLTGDVFGSERCDCGPQLREAVERIASEGGFLLYLRQEGRGIGLYAKLDAYALQDAGLDTYEANTALGRGEDERDYTAVAQMLRAIGADRIRLLSNNPDKALQLDVLGVRVVERVPTGVHLSAANVRYLTAKRDHTAHTLALPVG